MPAKPVLYYVMVSPPCRSVLLTAAALGVDLQLKEIDLLGLEHLEPAFLKVSAFVWQLIFFHSRLRRMNISLFHLFFSSFSLSLSPPPD